MSLLTQVLGGSLLRDFYKLLKHCVTAETDDVLRLHVQLACDEIDIFMKEFVFPWTLVELTGGDQGGDPFQTRMTKLTKRIHVLDPLDVD